MNKLNPKILSAYCYLNMLGGEGNRADREYNFFSNGEINGDYIEDDNLESAVEHAESAVDYYMKESDFLDISFTTDLYSVDERRDKDASFQYLALNVATQQWDYYKPEVYGERYAKDFKKKIPDKQAEREYFSQVLKELSKTNDFKQVHRDIMLTLQGFFDFLDKLPSYGLYDRKGGFDYYVDYGLTRYIQKFTRNKNDFTRKIEKAFNTPVLGKGY